MMFKAGDNVSCEDIGWEHVVVTETYGNNFNFEVVATKDRGASVYPGSWVKLPRCNPLHTAPKDGTIVRLLVVFDEHPLEDDNSIPQWTIGENSKDNTGEDKWQFPGWCWTHDVFTEAIGRVIAWLPMYEEEQHVATVTSWTNGSYWRNYKVDWHDNYLNDGDKLYKKV